MVTVTTVGSPTKIFVVWLQVTAIVTMINLDISYVSLTVYCIAQG